MKKIGSKGFTPHHRTRYGVIPEIDFEKHEKKSFQKPQTSACGAGFTFLEVILYIALTTIVIGVLFSFGWNMISAKTKAATVRETLAGARLVSERLKREIHSAQDINEDQPGKLVLTGEEGEITIESIGDKISIQRALGDPQFLHSDRVRIRDFQLTRQTSLDGKTQYVGFSFTAEAYYPEALDRYEYKFSTPFRSGAQVRI